MAVVVLDVAGAAVRDRGDRLDRLELLGALELGEDRVDRAAEVVGEDAEAAAVGHPEDDLVGAARWASVKTSSSIGTTASRPSIENIFWPR